jgi:toxin YoeB
MKLLWSEQAWNDYKYWTKNNNKQTLKKIANLIDDTLRSPYSGIGKPEHLKYDLSDKWSRKITTSDRMVYSVSEDTIYIYSLKDHYPIRETK